MNKEIEVNEHNIILRIPEDSVKLEVIAWIPDPEDDAKLIKVTKSFSPKQLQEMRWSFLENLGDDDYDAIYALTDEGKKWLDEMGEKANA